MLQKKIILITLAIAFNAFAAYFDFGVGKGVGLTSVDGKYVSNSDAVGEVEDCGDGCLSPAFEYGVRIGAPITQSLILAGEFEGMGNVYTEKNKYLVLNNFYVGPSLIFYRTKHLQRSGSMGFAWTDNRTNSSKADDENGTGIGMSLSMAFDTGTNNGALIGAKLFGS